MHNYSYDHQLFELDSLLSSYKSDETDWEDDFDPEEFEIGDDEETEDKDKDEEVEEEEDDEDEYDDFEIGEDEEV